MLAATGRRSITISNAGALAVAYDVKVRNMLFVDIMQVLYHVCVMQSFAVFFVAVVACIWCASMGELGE
jgi:hypothetical protein